MNQINNLAITFALLYNKTSNLLSNLSIISSSSCQQFQQSSSYSQFSSQSFFSFVHSPSLGLASYQYSQLDSYSSVLHLHSHSFGSFPFLHCLYPRLYLCYILFRSIVIVSFSSIFISHVLRGALFISDIFFVSNIFAFFNFFFRIFSTNVSASTVAKVLSAVLSAALSTMLTGSFYW